jgi:hypothetical protein
MVVCVDHGMENWSSKREFRLEKCEDALDRDRLLRKHFWGGLTDAHRYCCFDSR